MMIPMLGMRGRRPRVPAGRRARLIALAPLLAALSCVPGLATAAPAPASVLRLHGTAATAPVWSGSRALVLMESGSGYALRTLDPADGSSGNTVRVPHRYNRVGLAASGSLVAIGGVDEECDCKYLEYWVTADNVLAAPPGAVPVCTPSRCVGGGACFRPPAAPLVSGSTLVFESCQASGQSFSAIEDGSGGAPSELGQIAFPQSLAGEWLVGLAPGALDPPLGAGQPELIERNLATGAEPLRIALPPVMQAPQFFGGGEYPALAGVEEDGTIAYVLDSDGHNELWTASAGTPAPRLLGHSPIGTEPREAPPGGPSLVVKDGRVASFQGSGTVTVGTLAGAPLGSVRARSLDGFDFDGTRVLLAATPCSESFLATWAPGEAAPVLPGGRCPAPRIGRVRFAPRSIRVALSCPAQPPLGCIDTNVTVLAGVEGSAFELESSPREMLPAAGRTVAIALGRGEKRWLEHHRGAELTITVGAEIGEPGTYRRRARVRIP
jgi:hypothetical protein